VRGRPFPRQQYLLLRHTSCKPLITRHNCPEVVFTKSITPPPRLRSRFAGRAFATCPPKPKAKAEVPIRTSGKGIPPARGGGAFRRATYLFCKNGGVGSPLLSPFPTARDGLGCARREPPVFAQSARCRARHRTWRGACGAEIRACDSTDTSFHAAKCKAEIAMGNGFIFTVDSARLFAGKWRTARGGDGATHPRGYGANQDLCLAGVRGSLR
jgi:hypothetical protein